MKTNILIILIFFILVSTVSSQTIIQDSILSGRLIYAESPYIINHKITIPADSILTIEPRVVLKFKPSTTVGEPSDYGDFDYSALNVGMLQIDGKIIAEGTETDSIIFTRTDSVGNWGIILFTESADTNSILKYCKIEYGHRIFEIYNTSINGAVSFYNSKAIIENSNITNNKTIGISCRENSNPIILNNNISYNIAAPGIRCFNNSNAIIKNNSIRFCGNGIAIYEASPLIENNIIMESQHGIYCSSNSKPIIKENSIHTNLYGIKTWVAYPIIMGNQIFNNSVGFESEGGMEKTSILFNSFENNSSYAIKSQFDIYIEGNKIQNNEEGIICTRNSYILNNTIMYNNKNGIVYTFGECYIIGNLIFGNKQNGINAANGTTNITNNTIVQNSEAGVKLDYGGEIYAHLNSKLINNIIWNNQNGSINIGNPDCIVSAEYNLLSENQTELPSEIDFLNGNIFNIQPNFLDTLNLDFNLLENSPCVNAGKPDTTGMFLPEFDLNNTVRIISQRVDMGACESDFLDNIRNLAEENSNIEIYPNPAKDRISISKPICNVDYSIYNGQGKTISNGSLSNSNSIDISNFDSGLYYFKFSWENNIECKIVIVK